MGVDALRSSMALSLVVMMIKKSLAKERPLRPKPAQSK